MRKLLLILTLLSFVVFAEAQNYETTVKDGKTYYLYHVQKGEGLYRISKNFGVSQEEIVRLNPILKTEGVKLDQVLLIPIIETVDSTLYVVHEISAKETLYSISKHYKVSIAQIEELNPNTSQSMRIGERLLISKKAVTTVTTPTISKTSAQKIEEEIVIAEQTKTITKKEVDAKTTMVEKQKVEQINKLIEHTFAPEVVEEIIEVEDNTLLVDDITNDSLVSPTPIKLAVLLPLMTDAQTRDAGTERFMEFYEGLLLAVNDMQKLGHKFIIRTYDTDRTEARVQTILLDSAMKDMDAIIGPAYPQQVTHVSNFAKEHHIPVVIPFTSKVQDIENNPWLIQFNPNEEAMVQAVAKALTEHSRQLNYIFLKDDNTEITETAFILKEELKKHSLSIKEATTIQLLDGEADYLFANNKLNVIILPSDKYNNISNVVNRLKISSREYDICLVSQYSWQKENIGLNQIYAYLFDINNSSAADLETYQSNYQRFFKAGIKNDSPRYDILGYDLFTWLSYMLEQEGDNLNERIAAVGEYIGIQSNLNFEQISEKGGWMNTAIKIHDDTNK